LQRRLTLEIDKLIYGGKGLGRVEGKAVFVPFSLPGELVVVQEKLTKGSYIEAEIAEIIEKSPYRIEPLCPYFGVCGGCATEPMAEVCVTLVETPAEATAIDPVVFNGIECVTG